MTRDDTALSKTLSYWLRHKPEAAGLALDLAGWTPIDAVLAAFAAVGRPVDRDGLLRVVATSDKARFEVDAARELIRARQGHSVAVASDWVRAVPPAHLWHGTVERVLPAILAEGLRPMARHHVHLSSDPETARTVGARRGRPIVLRVAAGRLAAAGHPFWVTGNGVWLAEHVPPGAIERP
ncbi:RNA 2'-phosphotransferase [Methylobacterium indicum]|uniref:RNA 2'-phosphotransferase n=1 Tax=Methylobacterium indicum TaxID=1775910 RepID=UPI0024357FFE|nr:RNA 2'-phosphotransferase [Methylobacterium indicum]